MGTEAQVVVVGGSPDLAGAAQHRVDELERRWSRFLPDSEVSSLNRHAGEAVRVSADTVLLVQRAVAAFWMSGGTFDPTVLGALIRAGYDRTYDEVASSPADGRSPLVMAAEDIVVEAGTVRLPPGTGFDPGGIGKGLAADLVVAGTMAAGAAGVCVNLGGDVRVAGSGPDGGGWTVAVEHPASDRPLAMLGVAAGAVATSTTLRRRWQVGGAVRHHLIDPFTGQPSETDVVLATAVAAEGWAAEVLAKAVLLRGSAHGFDILGGTGVEAMVVTAGGEVLATAAFGRLLGGVPLPATLAA